MASAKIQLFMLMGILLDKRKSLLIVGSGGGGDPAGSSGKLVQPVLHSCLCFTVACATTGASQLETHRSQSSAVRAV